MYNCTSTRSTCTVVGLESSPTQLLLLVVMMDDDMKSTMQRPIRNRNTHGNNHNVLVLQRLLFMCSNALIISISYIVAFSSVQQQSIGVCYAFPVRSIRMNTRNKEQ